MVGTCLANLLEFFKQISAPRGHSTLELFLGNAQARHTSEHSTQSIRAALAVLLARVNATLRHSARTQRAESAQWKPRSSASWHRHRYIPRSCKHISQAVTVNIDDLERHTLKNNKPIVSSSAACAQSLSLSVPLKSVKIKMYAGVQRPGSTDEGALLMLRCSNTRTATPH